MVTREGRRPAVRRGSGRSLSPARHPPVGLPGLPPSAYSYQSDIILMDDRMVDTPATGGIP